MTQDWLKIKQSRSDLSDYLIHWTRDSSVDGVTKSPFEVLKSILKCGYLRPSFAPRTSVFGRGTRRTVRGPHPVVCFTEQPLSAFVKSCNTLPDRYRPYAVAVRKDRLFEYGGRPVVYGDEDLLGSLPEHEKFLWVAFNPIPKSSLGGYPLDWTHEREWRSTVNDYKVTGLGTYLTDGVPLLLPQTDSHRYLPWVIVSSTDEAAEMRRWVESLGEYKGANVLQREYHRNLRYVPIVPLDEVRMRLSKGENSWARIDTLPYSELEPSIAEQFEHLGWGGI